MAGPVQSFVPTPEGSPGHVEAEMPVIAALSGYLLTTVLIAIPLLLMARGRQRFRAGATVVVGTVSLLSVAVVGFPATPLAGAVGATAGAIIADLLLGWMPGGARSQWYLPVVAGGVAVLVWIGQLAGLAIVDAVRWPVSLWSGVVVLTGFTGVVLGLLARRPAVDAGTRGGRPLTQASSA
jgi:hypothetical protein